MIDTLRAYVEDGLAVMDRALLGRWLSIPQRAVELGYQLDVTLNRSGNTELKFDWPDEDWSDVWRRHSEQWHSRVVSEQLALLLLPEGEYALDLELSGSVPDDAVCIASNTINVESGLLTITSGDSLNMILIGARPDFDPRPCYWELSLHPGRYVVQMYVPANMHVVKRGHVAECGTETAPAIYVRVARSDTNTDPLSELPVLVLPDSS